MRKSACFLAWPFLVFDFQTVDVLAMTVLLLPFKYYRFHSVPLIELSFTFMQSIPSKTIVSQNIFAPHSVPGNCQPNKWGWKRKSGIRFGLFAGAKLFCMSAVLHWLIIYPNILLIDQTNYKTDGTQDLLFSQISTKCYCKTKTKSLISYFLFFFSLVNN